MCVHTYIFFEIVIGIGIDLKSQAEKNDYLYNTELYAMNVIYFFI